jgi:hypothetical protein
MGGGIAQVAAQIAKKNVILVDLNKAAVDKAVAFMGTRGWISYMHFHLCGVETNLFA